MLTRVLRVLLLSLGIACIAQIVNLLIHHWFATVCARPPACPTAIHGWILDCSCLADAALLACVFSFAVCVVLPGSISLGELFLARPTPRHVACGANVRLPVLHPQSVDRTRGVLMSLLTKTARWRLTGKIRKMVSFGDASAHMQQPLLSWSVTCLKHRQLRMTLTCRASGCAATLHRTQKSGFF